MARYKAVIVGAGRMAGTIDDEVLDYPACVLPYSHAAGYAEVPDIELAAFADPDFAKVEALQQRYGVPRGYRDYREMIETERPDIVSVTTPATLHAEIVVFAAERGAKAIYCEKALCCSLAEADAMTEAVQRHGVKFNTGTLRRWHPGMEALRDLIARGDLGDLQTVITYCCGGALHSASHFFDLMLFLAGDPELDWAQGTVFDSTFDPEAPTCDHDLSATGLVRFSNGVLCEVMDTSLWCDFEVIGRDGAVRMMNNGVEFEWRRRRAISGGKYDDFHPVPFPEYPRLSPTVRLIEDLVQAMATDGETRQGIRGAVKTADIAFGLIESHRQGGARVSYPLARRDFWMSSH